jgi:Mg-chelatase subunit ChlD
MAAASYSPQTIPTSVIRPNARDERILTLSVVVRRELLHIRGWVPPDRECQIMSRIRTTLLGALILVVVLFLTFCSGPKVDRELLDLLLSNRGALEYPGLEVDRAAGTLKTPQEALRFVQEDVQYIPYRGARVSAGGLLRTRAGNSTDKANLLAVLLAKLGWETRLVQADWPKEQEPEPGLRPPPVPDDFQSLASKIGFQQSETENFSSELEESLERVSEGVKQEVDLSLMLLESLVGELYLNYQARRENREQESWVWVQARKTSEDAWEDFDPTFPGLQRPGYREFSPVYSETSLELVAFHGDGTSSRLLQWSGDAAGHDLSLTFLPAGPPAMLERAVTPDDVDVWLPVLKVGPQAVRGAGFNLGGSVIQNLKGRAPVEFDDQGAPLIRAVPVRSLSVAEVEPSDFQRVRLTLEVEPEAEPQWHARHFEVVENGEACPVQIESVRAKPLPVLIVVDNSNSMLDNNKIGLAKEALQRLLQQLPAGRNVGIIAFWGSAQVLMEERPLSESRKDHIDAVNRLRGNEGGTDLIEAVGKALEMTEEPHYVIFITDGSDSTSYDFEKESQDLLPKIKASKSLFIPVGIDAADNRFLNQMAEASGTVFFSVVDTEQLPNIYQQLGSAISGRVILSYQALPGKGGEKRDFQLGLEGFEGTVSGSYIIPSEIRRQKPITAVQLSMKVPSPEGDQLLSRTLMDLEAGTDAWNLMSAYTIGISAGSYPSQVVSSRILDGWIEILSAATVIDGEPSVSLEFGRAMSVSHVRLVNGMRTVTQQVVGATESDLPQVFMIRSQLNQKGEELSRRTTLDWLSPHRLLAVDDSRTAARWGLAQGSVEARLIGAESVNAQMLDRKDKLKVYKTVEELPDNVPPALRAHVQQGWWSVLDPEAPHLCWLVYNGRGTVKCFLSEDRVSAKGASIEETAREFKKIRNLLGLYQTWGGAGLGLVGSPTGVLFSALASYYDELVRQTCYATLMLGFVNESMETGDFNAEKAQAESARLCEMNPGNTVQRTAKAFGWGFARGWAEAFANETAMHFARKGTAPPPHGSRRYWSGPSVPGGKAGEYAIGVGVGSANRMDFETPQFNGAVFNAVTEGFR